MVCWGVKASMVTVVFVEVVIVQKEWESLRGRGCTMFLFKGKMEYFHLQYFTLITRVGCKPEMLKSGSLKEEWSISSATYILCCAATGKERKNDDGVALSSH